MQPTNRLIGLFVIVAVLAGALAYSIVSTVQQGSDLCDFQQRSFTIQRQQILDDAKPAKPTEAVLRAFPELRPFYDIRNPLYKEQVDALNRVADRRLRVLGSQPNC